MSLPETQSESPVRYGDVAIIGMAAIYPKAPDIATLWQNIVSKVDAITDVPRDRWEKERLIVSNLRFVVSIAVRYQNLGLPLMDLINEGNMGLLRAVEKFDVSKGFKFISYARWWIRHFILKAIFEQSTSIKLPLKYATQLSKRDDLQESESWIMVKGNTD